MRKAIILDFDGTLANTAHILQKIYNQMAEKRGWTKMSAHDYRRLRKVKTGQVLEWAGVHHWELPILLYRGRKLFLREISEVELFTDMPELVKDLRKSGWDIYILSKNSERAVKQVLADNKLDDDVHTLKRASLLGKHRNIKKFLKQFKYDKDNVWMIGDETHDIEAAKKAGVKIISVSWGLQDEKILSTYEPNFIAESTEDIRKILC